jgi:hypothetical protein
MDSSEGFIPYDQNVHGVLHQQDWKFHARLGEAEIAAIEHVKTGTLFFPTAFIDATGRTRFGTTWQTPDDALDPTTILSLAQHALRFYCLHLKTTPEAEITDHIARTPR